MADDANPYNVLGIDLGASESDIKKAYRVLALKYHPDKDPSAHAAVMFEKVTQAQRLLTDPAAKAAYDKVYQLKKAAELRDQKLHAERRKAKDDLEEREQQARAKRAKGDMQDAQKTLEAQIQRIRDENSRKIYEEQQKLRQYMAENPAPAPTPADKGGSLKLRWSTDGEAPNGGYSKELLARLFRKYGEMVVVLSKKEGSAIIDFARTDDAVFAKRTERGLPANPFTRITMIDDDSTATPPPEMPSYVHTLQKPKAAPAPAPVTKASQADEEDYEQQVLLKMMQAHNKAAS